MPLKTIHLIGKTLFIMLFPLFVATQSFAQATNSGKEFYVAFGKNDTITLVKNLWYLNGEYVLQDGSVDLILRITALADSEVTLSFTENSTLNTTFTVQSGEIRDYHLTVDQARAAYSGLGTYINAYNNKKSIHVTATKPINLVAISAASRSIEATLVWPVESWGTEYYNTGINPRNSSHSNGYIIIAKENGTKITHVNSVSSKFDYTLDAGGIYYASSNSANNYLIGAHVISDKPVAFFNTNTNAHLTFGSNDRYNYNFEQLLPVNSWGKEFILPTNEIVNISNPNIVSEAIQARIIAKEANTTITVKYPDGTTNTYTLGEGGRQDITINNSNNPTAKAGYISSNKPVGITAYHIAKNPADEWRPGEAWISPIEQATRNVLISPLDFNTAYMTQRVHHYFSIITPTKFKDKTTISIDGGPVQPIQNLYQPVQNQPGFIWVEDSIGGSDYSLGRYYFGASQAEIDNFLNTTVLVDNPAGLLAYAWGHGFYANYFYNAGSAASSFEIMPHINGINFYEANGQVFCNNVFDITAVTNLSNSQNNSYPKWYFNGVEDPDLAGRGLVEPGSYDMFTEILTQSDHTIKMEFLDVNGNLQAHETTFTVSSAPVVGTLTILDVCNNSSFDPNPPTVVSDIILSEGWQMETAVESGAYENISAPYTVSLSDTGKRIRYYVENYCGVVYSNSQTIFVNPLVVPSVEITVKVN